MKNISKLKLLINKILIIILNLSIESVRAIDLYKNIKKQEF